MHYYAYSRANMQNSATDEFWEESSGTFAGHGLWHLVLGARGTGKLPPRPISQRRNDHFGRRLRDYPLESKTKKELP
jgi:hypothetical protein